MNLDSSAIESICMIYTICFIENIAQYPVKSVEWRVIRDKRQTYVYNVMMKWKLKRVINNKRYDCKINQLPLYNNDYLVNGTRWTNYKNKRKGATI